MYCSFIFYLYLPFCLCWCSSPAKLKLFKKNTNGRQKFYLHENVSTATTPAFIILKTIKAAKYRITCSVNVVPLLYGILYFDS